MGGGARPHHGQGLRAAGAAIGASEVRLHLTNLEPRFATPSTSKWMPWTRDEVYALELTQYHQGVRLRGATAQTYPTLLLTSLREVLWSVNTSAPSARRQAERERSGRT